MRVLLSTVLLSFAALGLVDVDALAHDIGNTTTPIISEVSIKFEDAAFGRKDTLTIIGHNLAGRSDR